MNLNKFYKFHRIVLNRKVLRQSCSCLLNCNRLMVDHAKKENLLRHFSLKTPLSRDIFKDNQEKDEANEEILDENDYWNYIEKLTELEEEKAPLISNDLKSQFKEGSKLDYYKEKKVFILQVKMQYKAKARQSTTAELQLAESVALVETLPNCKVIDSLILGSKTVGAREIFGAGNQEMLSKKIPASGANCLFIVIDRLTNAQVNSIRQNLLGNNPNIIIYDRYKMVLEIFKSNAHSSIAKLQIALAEIPYIRHKFDNFDLYKSVEKKIKKKLAEKLKTRVQTNSNRKDKHIPTVAVFGYTNAGKTSFIKCLTDDNKMIPENKLFATLDITYHHMAGSKSSQNIIFADTIGFISDIPHTLVESFKTTINDALNADLFIHLVDLSHPDCESQQKTVIEILTELAPEEKIKNMITIYNKCDLIDSKIISNRNDDAFYVSCKTGLGLSEAKENLDKLVYKKLGFIQLNLKVEQGSEALSFLYKNSILKNVRQFDEDPQFLIANVLINKVNAIKFANLYPNIKISK